MSCSDFHPSRLRADDKHRRSDCCGLRLHRDGRPELGGRAGHELHPGRDLEARSSMADWLRHFDEPIPLPGGGELVTLKDAGTYVTRLPKAEHEAPEWQAAMEALILVTTKGGPTMLARIGMLRGLSR